MNPILLILIATGLASLVGLEREMRIQTDHKKDTFGGVRTFAMLGALGAVSMMISDVFAILVASSSFLLIAMSHIVSSIKNENLGLTSEFSAVASFLIGVLVAKEEMTLAIAISILFTAILALRHWLHHIAKSLEMDELFAIIKFLVISAVVLPYLPNEYIDSWDIFNPYHVWLMVIFVAAIRFVAFFLAKIIGSKKSIVVTGIIGGLASSTAVTSALSDESKKNEKNINPFLVGILFANMLMFFRVILEVVVVNHEMTMHIVYPLSAMGIVAGILGVFTLFQKNKDVQIHQEPEISQPFSLSKALKFGLFFLFVSAATKLIPMFLGNMGLYATAIVSGLADTDAITLTVANLVKIGDIEMQTGVSTIVLAVMVNTLVKIAIIYIFGARKLFKYSLAAFLVIFSIGTAILFLI